MHNTVNHSPTSLRVVFSFILAMSIVFGMSIVSLADPVDPNDEPSGIAIDETTFPDANFRTYISNSIDTDSDGYLSETEISEKKTIDIIEEDNITDITGIKCFTSLKCLFCDCDYIYTIDVSDMTSLTDVYVKDVACLDELNVDGCSGLTFLECSGTRVTSLNLSDCTELQSLYCSNTNISSLDLSQCASLEVLECNNCQLTSLDLSNNTFLSKLYCKDNNITELKVEDCASLEELYCSNNKIQSLNLSSASLLTHLECNNNELTNLLIGVNLQTLDFSNNNITSIDLSRGTTIQTLKCENNQLSRLTLSSTKLSYLSCQNNNLTALEIPDSSPLGRLYCSDNKLSTLNVSSFSALYLLDCSNNQITTIDVSNNAKLWSLDCSNNVLSLITLGENTKITSLIAHNNNLSVIDISGCPEVEYTYKNALDDSSSYIIHYGFDQPNNSLNIKKIFTHDNNVSVIFNGEAPTFVVINSQNFPDEGFRNYIDSAFDINDDNRLGALEIERATYIYADNLGISDLTGLEYFTSLRQLECPRNNLTDLDVSGFPQLITLDISSNQFSSIDVSNNLALISLKVSNNPINSLNVTNNSNLTTLMCNNCGLSVLNINNNMKLNHLRCNNNNLLSLDVSNHSDLVYLFCDSNSLESINISGCAKLEHLICSGNNLKTLDINDCTKLTEFYCQDNDLTEIDISKTVLEYIYHHPTYVSSNTNYYCYGTLNGYHGIYGGIYYLCVDNDVTVITNTPTFSGHSLLLSNSIGVVFRIAVPDSFDKDNCYIEFVSSDGRKSTCTFNEYTSSSNGYEYSYIFDINAIELADNITATVHYDNGRSVSNTYSAMEYIEYVQNHWQTFNKGEKLLNLVNSLQDYGYYMQQSGWGDNATHNPIPEPVKKLNDNDVSSAISGLNGYELTANLGTSGVDSNIRVALTLNAKTEIRVLVKLTPGTIISSTDYTEVLIGNQLYYQFSISGIGPKNLDVKNNLIISTDQGDATIQVSALYYLKAMMNSGTLNNSQMYALTAYYNYYVAAEAY